MVVARTEAERLRNAANVRKLRQRQLERTAGKEETALVGEHSSMLRWELKRPSDGV